MNAGRARLVTLEGGVFWFSSYLSLPPSCAQMKTALFVVVAAWDKVDMVAWERDEPKSRLTIPNRGERPPAERSCVR